MVTLKELLQGIKSVSNVISRVVNLENRVTALEKKIEKLQTPPTDIKEGLEYNKQLHLYANKVTGENFCPVCIGNGKKIPIVMRNEDDGTTGWNCFNCRAAHWDEL